MNVAVRHAILNQAGHNLLLQSENIAATWTNSGSTENTNATAGLDGTETADRLIDDVAGGAQAAVSVIQTITPAASTPHTISAYLKQDQLAWARVRVTNLSAQSIAAYYDLANGVVGANLGTNQIGQGIDRAPNGFWRCWVSFSVLNGDTSGEVEVGCADDTGDASVDRDGTSSIFIGGVQMNRGTRPLRYRKTTTVTVGA